MQKLKKLPIGIQSFSRMIEGNFIYVDKTNYILDLIESGDCYFLSRPRRFGKSLLLSTLHELFLGNRKLFESLAIAQSTHDWEKHPVIHLSLSAMSTSSAEDLSKDLMWNLTQIAQDNGIDISDAPSLKTKFSALIKRLAASNRVVILIDEYDYPLINNINNLDLAGSCRALLHDFFIVLKDEADYIKFIFISGVSKFSKTSIFSGLNNLNDISLSKKAALLLGYTHNELQTYFPEYLNAFAQDAKADKAEVLENMRTWYNGYQFAEPDDDAQNKLKVYNPFSVLFCLSNKRLLNYWADTGTPSFLVHLIQTQKYPLTHIEGSQVNIDETIYEIDKIKPIALLWQTGYLTIDSYNSKTQNYTLKYPNAEIFEDFQKTLSNF